MTASKVAWVAGASGLVGGQLVQQLARNPEYTEVKALVRSKIPHKWQDLEKVEQVQVNYDKLEDALGGHQVDAVFCALGTTAKKTPDKKQYYKIDVNYPHNIAKLALKQGAQFYGLVSAHGANASSFSHYLKLKGRLEKKLRAMSFPALCIARPGILKGERPEFRFAERIGEFIANLLPGNYKAIDAADVSAALIMSSLGQHNKPEAAKVLSSATMQGSAQKLMVQQTQKL